MGKEVEVIKKDYTQGELWEETLRIDVERKKSIEEAQRVAAEKKKIEEEEYHRRMAEDARILYRSKSKQKPIPNYAQSGVIINLKNGKVRKPKKGEVRLHILDPFSDPSLEDGEPVFTKEGKVIKHGKNAKKD
jgi:hypothetical protein